MKNRHNSWSLKQIIFLLKLVRTSFTVRLKHLSGQRRPESSHTFPWKNGCLVFFLRPGMNSAPLCWREAKKWGIISATSEQRENLEACSILLKPNCGKITQKAFREVEQHCEESLDQQSNVTPCVPNLMASLCNDKSRSSVLRVNLLCNDELSL